MQRVSTPFAGSSSSPGGGVPERRRIDRRRQLVPDFYLVPVRIGSEDVRLSRTEFSLTRDGATGTLDRSCRPIDISGTVEAESEMRNAARCAGLRCVRLFEHDDVARSGRLHLDEAVLPIYLHRAEDMSVKARCAVDVANGERDMGQTMRTNHGRIRDHIMTGMKFVGRLRPAALLFALIWPMTQAEMERALSIGRAFDAERARFHKPYMLAIADPTVEQIEVVTEFRRVVMFAEEQIRHGDHMFGLRQTEPAMRPWHGKLTIAARLRFHPMNTFRASPPYDITVGAPPIPRLDTRRTSLYALASSQKPATPTPLTGAIVEVDFDAQTVGQAVRQVRVVLEGKEVLRTMVDFATLQ